MMPTIRNPNSATQFSGSAIVKVPTGGRKKKLRTSIATIEATTATQRRDSVAVASTTSSSTSATVVWLMVGSARKTKATAAMATALPMRTRTSREITWRDI